MNKEVGIWLKIGFMLGQIFCGSMHTITVKTQNMQFAAGTHYHHPFIQVWCSYAGLTLLCIPVLYSYIKGTRTPLTKEKLAFIIPPIIQVLTLNFQYAGLIMTAASVTQMMYGSTVLWSALFSFILLKKRFTAFQYSSIGAIVIGTITVGLSTAFLSGDTKTPTTFTGVFLIAISQMLSGAFIVSEEIIYRRIAIDPAEAVAIEGVSGVIYALLIIFGASYLFDAENPSMALQQIGENKILLIFVIMQFFAVAGSSYFGNSLTKYISGMARSTTNTVRTVAVWSVCLCLGWEKFIFLQFVGYSIMTYGVLAYNGLLTPKVHTDELEKAVPLKEIIPRI